MGHKQTVRLVAGFLVLLLGGIASCAAPDSNMAIAGPEWAVPSLPYRILVEVPAVDTGSRESDSLPASVDLDFNSEQFATLNLSGQVDLDSILVVRYDAQTGKPLPAPPWPFSRDQRELASHFLDELLLRDFPMSDQVRASDAVTGTFPRGAFRVNVKGKSNRGLLTWDHHQNGAASSYYAVYFNTLARGETQKVPRQGFLGDGLPRRTGGNTSSLAPTQISAGIQRSDNPSLTGTLYNSVTVDDWDGDGLADIIVGEGFGNLLLFRNEGDKAQPKFNAGEFLVDANGRPLDVGWMAKPIIVDWNGDGAKDLVVGEEKTAGVVWYQNTGSNADRRLVYRGHVKSDGKDLIVPATPCPESPHYKKDYAPAVEAVDWDNDGRLDLLLGGYITGRIWYYRNIGNGSDGTPTLTFNGSIEADGKPIDTVWGAHPCAIDLDGDGDLDLLSGSFGQAVGGGDAFQRFLIYYKNIGTRSQPKLVAQTVDYDGEEPRDIIAQPRIFGVNEKGLVDLVISTYEHIYLARNVGTKEAPKWKLELQQPPWGPAPLSATQLIDLNGDGQLDLVSSPMDGPGEPQIRYNQGKGSHGVFSAPQPLLPDGQKISHPAPYGDPWAYCYLYDFDGDHNLDILWADGPGNVYLHRNRGTAQRPVYDTEGEKLKLVDGKPIKVGPPVVSVEEVSDFTVMQGSRAGVVASDFNGDGKTDVVVGDTYGDIYYFENAGTSQAPVFAQGVKLGNLANRAIPLAYDWDRDGRLDIVGNAWSGRMEWYRNLGAGARPQFAAGQPLDLPKVVPYSPRLLIADWNRDGDDDFLIMSSYPWFCWLEGSYLRHGYARGQIVAVESRR